MSYFRILDYNKRNWKAKYNAWRRESTSSLKIRRTHKLR